MHCVTCLPRISSCCTPQTNMCDQPFTASTKRYCVENKSLCYRTCVGLVRTYPFVLILGVGRTHGSFAIHRRHGVSSDTQTFYRSLRHISLFSTARPLRSRRKTPTCHGSRLEPKDLPGPDVNSPHENGGRSFLELNTKKSVITLPCGSLGWNPKQ